MRSYGAIIAVATLAVLAACGNDDAVGTMKNVDPESVATMTTRNVETLVSDSGVTRYRIVAPLWLVYDEAREPHWRFPNSLHLERFDNDLMIEATIDCDSATYFKNKQLWRLDGNVRVLNTLGERFLTEQLFWDQRAEKVYSDSFIHIERADRTLEGYGFESNQRMTKFSVSNVSAILPASQFEPGTDRDSLDVNGDESEILADGLGSERAEVVDTAERSPKRRVVGNQPRQPHRPRQLRRENQD